MFVYKIDVLQELRNIGYNVPKIREKNLLGQAALQKIRDGKVIGIIQLNTLCAMLQCQPGDIIEFVPDESDKI